MSKQYNIIYIDPPWQYRDARKTGGKAYLGAEAQYTTIPTSVLCELNIKNICAKDCVMFMWVTSPLLPDGLRLFDAWGFKYKTVGFCWNKKTKTGKDQFLFGHWTGSNVELCLIGVRGKPKRVDKTVRQLVPALRSEHSKKPDEVRNRIVQLMGDLPRVELFATKLVEGWDCVGFKANGVNVFDFIEEAQND